MNGLNWPSQCPNSKEPFPSKTINQSDHNPQFRHNKKQNQIPRFQIPLNGHNPISIMNLTTPTTAMDDPHKLQNLPSFKLSRYSSTVRDSDAGDDLRYTSLKDILLNSPSYSGVNEFNEFNLSNITIRNELVKRAASAYLQSAAILVGRNESCFVGFWERLRIKLAALRSRWCDCFPRFFGFFRFAF